MSMKNRIRNFSIGILSTGIGLSFVGASCCPTPASPTGFNLNLNPHPQAQKLKAGKLESFWRFEGKATGGVIPGIDVVRGYYQNGVPADVHFEWADKDPCVKSADIRLYRTWIEGADGKRDYLCGGENYPIGAVPNESVKCGGDAQLARVNGLAVAIPGYFDQQKTRAQLIDSDQYFTMACITGVAAKCEHWGYVLGAKHEATGKSLDPYYKACVHAALADYKNLYDSNSAGATFSYTCDGTIIDIFDNLEIQEDNKVGKEESAWDANGLLSIIRSRFAGCKTDIQSLLQYQKPDTGWLVKINSADNDTWVEKGLCPGSSPRADVCDH